MKLIVKTLQSKIYEMDVELSDKILDLKIKLGEKVPADPNNIKLVLFGKTPENEKTMADLNIKEGDFMIMMILKPVQKKEEQKKEAQPSQEVKKEEAKKEEVKEELKKEEPKKDQLNAEEHKDLPKKEPEQPKKEEKKKEEQKIDVNQDSLNAMIAMGFDPTLSSKALQMSSNNVDLAIDLISSGDIAFMPHPHQAHPKVPSQNPGAHAHDPHGQHPQQQPGQNPQNQALLAALLSQLQSHPELIQGLQNNPQQLNSLLQQQQPQMVEIPAVLETKDAEAVARLKQLGLFTEQECKEAYFACGKNEEIAANYLLEGRFNADNGDNAEN